MLKVMLVDDENLIVEGLKHIIEWDELGLEVVVTANDGMQAIERFKKNPVDIVVTDINMPRVTGLELLKSLKEINDDVRFIVLSGYDTFSYAKKAIELGVKSYLLKPVDEEELESTLKSIVDDINNGKKREQNLVIKNGKIIDFINSKINVEELIEFASIMKIRFDGQAYRVANILHGAANIDEVISCIKENVLSTFEIVPNHDGTIILINSFEQQNSEQGIREFYKIIKDTVKDELGTDIFISVGSVVTDFKEMPQSFRESRNAKKYVLVEGYDKVLFSEDIDISDFESLDFKKEIESINKFVIEKNKDAVKEYILEVFRNKSLTPKHIYDLSIKVVILIDDILREFNLENKYGRESLSSAIVDLCSEDTRENIEKFLVTELEELIKVISDNIQVYSPVVQQVVKVINEEYKEELSLKTLAAKYRINSSYLGQIFSKEVGVSFSEYLNKIKNTKAKELILNTNMKINNIAKEVGYTDTSYFYRKFKKYYGVCPSTLREMKNY
ncbi:response regulator transcription factor [uncultured Clostridium sp.]|jgi:two-component system response regulator YesN|uniref:response regulator transcription factor n=1 Tax=uncultured Clostridium sp. TaxID=59620 RepID=UPI00261220CB|nr:response regulator transcription factor [uncultured Clostridium sp.]